jgi:hypothetical protein
MIIIARPVFTMGQIEISTGTMQSLNRKSFPYCSIANLQYDAKQITADSKYTTKQIVIAILS